MADEFVYKLDTNNRVIKTAIKVIDTAHKDELVAQWNNSIVTGTDIGSDLYFDGIPKWKKSGSNVVQVADADIKKTLNWMEVKKNSLERKISIDIVNLGEAKIQSLMAKQSKLKDASSDISTEEKADRDEFINERQIALDQYHVDTATDGFSRLKLNTVNTNAPSVDVKDSSIFSVNDTVICKDFGKDAKQEQTTISAISGDTITFETALTNSTKYKKRTSFLFNLTQGA